ncbi:MAG: hypothetical protein OQK09_13765 [Colwellia sp.]|nr:hypothetical protein [Colwellia sp.]MCW9082574.1 hypothetical protein [Colwellia sp.]
MLELKKKAIEAEEVYCEILDRVSEWESIIEHSDNLVKFLDLDIGEENKNFINKLNDISIALNRANEELEAERDNLVLVYALAKLGGKLGDIVDYVDLFGRKRAISVENAQLMGDNIAVTGSRLLKAGKIGTRGDYVCLDTFSWKLRE